jgi:Fe-S-cluster-containing dehydrogenase component
MADKILLIDIDKCVGCYACEIACKQENELPLASRWCRVISLGPRKLGGEFYLDFVPTVCNHCGEPVCSYFCRFDAITKRKDGIVLISKDDCTGCGLCVSGCPYGAIYLDDEKSVAGKCTLCSSRIDDGLEPSCVQHCVSGALQFVTEEELAETTQGVSIGRKGNVCYVSNKWKLSL